jgi:pimeloyl-ACP methyl ester carboxylesterase
VVDPSRLPGAIRALFPFDSHFLDVDGGSMHYIDEGPRDGDVLLAVHGNPTWSFYWRRLIETFRKTHRVVVLDHIGCGLSDKPQDWPYRLAGHRDNLLKLVEHLDLNDITLAVHDWGGAIGMAMAARAPERISRLIVTNTAAFRSKEIPFSIATCRWPVFGPLMVRGFNAFARAATIRAASSPLPRPVRDGLVLPYDSWANRIATLRFVEDIPLSEDHPSYADLLEVEEGLAQFTDRPMLICWGDGDFCFTDSFRAEWQRRFPDAEVHAWPEVGHYVMEDAHSRVLPLIASFFEQHPLGNAE